MARKKSEVDQIISALTALRNVDVEWSEGFRSPIIRERLEELRLNLQDSLVEILAQKAGPVKEKK